MRKHLLVAGIAVATLLPSLALAQETCEQRSANRTAGTVVGAVRQSRYGVELWKYFLGLAIALALAEMAVGREPSHE